ncbi:MAG: transketolase [Proteobacteria bacterium]|nr:transketolase [Pseudomonadota bacterium]
MLSVAYGRWLNVSAATAHSPTRDILILSKGHAASALYAVLAYQEFFPREQLRNFNQPGSGLPEQPSPGCVPGVEWATGSLGHGLSVALGRSIGCRILGVKSRHMVIMSDGECNEGSVWEAAMFAPAQRTANLGVVVDFNKWQATGRSCETMALEPLASKFEAFGWAVREVDGHNLQQLDDAFRFYTEQSEKPTAIIAHTIKGKGVSFMEDDNNWHYRVPNKSEVEAALRELGQERFI